MLESLHRYIYPGILHNWVVFYKVVTAENSVKFSTCSIHIKWGLNLMWTGANRVLEASQVFLEEVSCHLHMMEREIAVPCWNKTSQLGNLTSINECQWSVKKDLCISYLSRKTSVLLMVFVNSKKVHTMLLRVIITKSQNILLTG